MKSAIAGQSTVRDDQLIGGQRKALLLVQSVGQVGAQAGSPWVAPYCKAVALWLVSTVSEAANSSSVGNEAGS